MCKAAVDTSLVLPFFKDYKPPLKPNTSKENLAGAQAAGAAAALVALMLRKYITQVYTF